jgi:hypothetical protein
MADMEKVSASGDMPLRVTGEAVKYLSSLPQFHGIPDSVLIRLAARRTRLSVADRWVAIALIVRNRIPVPVPSPPAQPQVRLGVATAPAKLELIIGRKK